MVLDAEGCWIILKTLAALPDHEGNVETIDRIPVMCVCFVLMRTLVFVWVFARGLVGFVLDTCFKHDAHPEHLSPRVLPIML